MAGLTKEQRAAKAAESQAGLVAMQKDGVTAHVHPTCVKSHQDCGWKVIHD